MASLPAPDDFPYVHQDEDLPACVPACVLMVCTHLGIEVGWEELTADLGFDPQTGTPFANIENLRRLVAIRVDSLEEVEQRLDLPSPDPVIANLFVPDDELLGYSLNPDASLHAVVVVAIDERSATFSDPLSHAMRSTEAHTTCSRRVFAGSWLGGYALRKLPG